MNSISAVPTNPVAKKKTNWFLSFTGLIPLVLTIPLLLVHLWTICIIVTIASSLIVMGFEMRSGHGVGSINMLTLLFGLANAVLYFGFHTTLLLQNLGTVIYTLLCAQVVYSLLRKDPWTVQFAKRSVPEAVWATRAFREANLALTILWGGVFLIDDLITLLVPAGLVQTLLPFALIAIMVVMTPRIPRLFKNR